ALVPPAGAASVARELARRDRVRRPHPRPAGPPAGDPGPAQPGGHDLMDRRRAAGPLLVIALSAIALAVLDASGQAFWQGLAINLAMFVILTVALNLTSGFTGVFSLGQIGFMALGAYVAAILTLPLRDKAAYLPDLPSWIAGVHLDQTVGPVPVGFLVATIIAGIFVSVVAWPVGRVLMRLSGHFVAVATLGFLVIVRVVLVNGGMGSVSGSIIGAAFIVALSEALRRIEDATLLYGLSGIVLAVIFIVVITVRREGLLGQREVPLDRLFARRAKTTD